jgi:NTE family protein
MARLDPKVGAAARIFFMPFPALDALFAAHGQASNLRGGDVFINAGEAPLGLCRLTAGRLAAVEPTGDGGSRVLLIHRPDALIGGAELLTGDPHPVTLTALRDSEIQSISRTIIEPLLRRSPVLLAELARSSLAAMREPAAATRTKGVILGFVAVCDSVAMRDLVEALAERMRNMGASVAVLGAEADSCSSAELSQLEAEHDFLLMAAERQDFDFAEFCGRQIDRLILVGSAHSPLPDGPFRFAAVAIQRHRLMDLILIQPPDTARPNGSARWLAAAPAARLFQIRRDDRGDLDRLARIFTGRSVGLVLSGGGARAYAHVGVLRALRALQVPVDFLAGASMGAVVAGGVAMGWDDLELDERLRAAFVASSPLADIAFPMLAMTFGREVARRLEEHFGDAEIPDLWRPFTCVSTDLTAGEAFAHHTGRLRDALRATISLPGVLPPVVLDGRVLVDGAVANNLPVDLVRSQHDGVTIGVDVARASGLAPDELKLRPAGLRWLTSGAWRRGPPIVSVLMRAATMPTARIADSMRDALDIVIEPELDGVQLRDWKAYEPAVEAGYRATWAQAERLSQYSV